AICGLGIGFCGLCRPGLLPPDAGCWWHILQELPLKVGPRPLPSSPLTPSPVTESTSSNAACAPMNNACSCVDRPGSGMPAADSPPRGPGSVAATAVHCTAATPLHVAPEPVKFCTRLPLMLFRLATVGLNVQPPRDGWTDQDAVAPGTLSANE